MSATVPCGFGEIRRAIKVEREGECSCVQTSLELAGRCELLLSDVAEIRLIDKAGVSYASGPFDRMTAYKLTI
jgi:hypothetical protein